MTKPKIMESMTNQQIHFSNKSIDYAIFRIHPLVQIFKTQNHNNLLVLFFSYKFIHWY